MALDSEGESKDSSSSVNDPLDASNATDDVLGSPDKKRKREEKSDGGVDGLSGDPSLPASSVVSPSDLTSSDDPGRSSRQNFTDSESSKVSITRSASIPSVLERALTPTNICDKPIEETLHELDELFARLDDVSDETVQQVNNVAKSKSVDDEPSRERGSSSELHSGNEDPLSQFLDLTSDGLSDALEKIQRNSSINDPETMDLSYGKLKSEMEHAKPSRSPSSLFFDDCSTSSASTSYHDSVSTEREGSGPGTLVENSIGPFLQALLLKLEGMLHNSYSVNLLLTGVIIRLAAYPQPIIRSFLLHPSLVFQPNVKSLIQVLHTLKQKLDHFSYSVDNFEDLLGRSRKFLRLRELESGIQLATGRKLVPNLRHPRATTSPTSTTIA